MKHFQVRSAMLCVFGAMMVDHLNTVEAEFSFQQGDIIAVTSTPEDGWWSGELLDEARRLPGRNDFPSNL